MHQILRANGYFQLARVNISAKENIGSAFTSVLLKLSIIELKTYFINKSIYSEFTGNSISKQVQLGSAASFLEK